MAVNMTKETKDGYIIDFISGQEVKATPEEIEAVQVFAKQLVEDYGYPKDHIQTRPQFRVKVRPSDTKKEYPVDIAVFPNDKKQEDDKAKYYHYIGTGTGDQSVEIVMDEIKIDKKTSRPEGFPYYDFHGERIKGRWLGLGVAERLFDIQEQVNTLINQNNEVNNIASLLLFRTADVKRTGGFKGWHQHPLVRSEDLGAFPHELNAGDNHGIGLMVSSEPCHFK